MLPRPAAAAGLALLAALACARVPPVITGAETPPDVELPRGVRPLGYALELAVDSQGERFQGSVVIPLELAHPSSVLWLHAQDLELGEASVEVGGQRRPATLAQVTESGAARLRVERPIPQGRATLRVAFEGVLGDGPGRGGLVRVRSGGVVHVLLATGPAGARRVFPCLDDPAFRTSFELALVVPEGWRTSWIAPEASVAPAGVGRKRVRFAATSPLPTHLLLAAAGPFAVVERPPLPAAAPRLVALPLRGLGPPGLVASLGPVLETARGLVPALEALLDAAYPAPRLEVVLLPGLREPLGAPGLVVSPGGYDAGQPGAEPSVDGALLGAGSTEEVRDAGPAIARAWFGGAAGVSRWRDLWVDEGLAAVAAGTAMRAWRGPGVAEREVLGIDAALQAQLLPGARSLRPAVNRVADLAALSGPFFRARAAGLLRAWERALGAGRFREALRAWLGRPGVGRSGDDLAGALSQAAGRDVGPALRALADAAGVVRLDARVTCDAAGPRLELSVGRARLPGSAWAPPAPAGGLPVCARYEAAGALGEGCTVLEGARGALPFPACPRWVMPVAGGVAPWRWLLPPGDRARLRDVGFLHLSPPERLAWAVDLRAAARAGELPMSEVLASLAPLARDGDARVAEAAIRLFDAALAELLPRPLLVVARARVAELYRPRLRELGLDPGFTEPPPRAHLRRAVAELLVLSLRDPEATRSLAVRGRQWLGLGSERRRPAAVAPALVPAALAATLDDGGAAVFDAIEARLLAGDGDRGLLCGALGTARDPALSARALALVSDARLAPEERARLLRGQLEQPETFEAAWKTLQRRWDLVAPALLGPEAEELPGLAAALCDRERAVALRTFLDKRTERMPALGRRAPQAVAAVEACAALREAQGASAAAWFAGQ